MSAKAEADRKEAWRRIVDRLHVARIHGCPAVNKPLMLLLIFSRAKKRGDNRFVFPELSTDIREALARFGPKHKGVSPALGFWHLQRDGFWILHGLDRATLGPNQKAPTVTALRDKHVYATVRDDLWKELAEDSELTQELANRIIHKFLSSQDQHAVAAFFGFSVQ